MEIRKATPADTDDILRMLLEISKVHNAGRPDLFRVATKYDRAGVLALLDDPAHLVLVADDGTRAVGYAICVLQLHEGDRVLQPVKTLYLDDLCVDSVERGHGLGERLLVAAREEARAMGCHNFTLNVWACNERARRFYERCGMKVQKIGMEVVF